MLILLPMSPEIASYNSIQSPSDKIICDKLLQKMDAVLTNAVSKIWHAHPVWFIDDNPIAGYSKQKAGIRLMFWSGASFDEVNLNIIGKKFKDASIIYKSPEDIDLLDLERWLQKSIEIQCDYKNIVKRKGRLDRLK